MDQVMGRMASWIADMVVSALLLTPVLALARLALPLPWAVVLLPWAGAFHLLLCWTAGRILAAILCALCSGQ